MSTKHSKAAGKFLENKELAAWHDETLWMVRAKRDKVSKEVPEWEHLRDMASAIKMYSNSHLDQLLLEFEKNALANGAYVYWAKDADEYCSIVYNILTGLHEFCIPCTKVSLPCPVLLWQCMRLSSTVIYPGQ